MPLEDDLYEIEEGFWLRGGEHFLDHVDDRCLLAFPQAPEMHGLLDRESVAATAAARDRWRDVAMKDRHCLVAGDVAIISYRADARRADGEPYSALIGSAYVSRPSGWKLAFHQHSPLQAGSEAANATNTGDPHDG